MGWKYSPAPLPVSMTLFRAGQLTEETDFTTDFTNGWADLPSRGLNVTTLDCQRLEMLKAPWSKQLAELMEKNCLATDAGC